LYLTEVLVARTGTFSQLIDRIRAQLQSISSRERGAPDGMLVVLISWPLTAKMLGNRVERGGAKDLLSTPDIPRSGGSQSCPHYQSLTFVSDTTARA
jgi:hypothetical protein